MLLTRYSSTFIINHNAAFKKVNKKLPKILIAHYKCNTTVIRKIFIVYSHEISPLKKRVGEHAFLFSTAISLLPIHSKKAPAMDAVFCDIMKNHFSSFSANYSFEYSRASAGASFQDMARLIYKLLKPLD